MSWNAPFITETQRFDEAFEISGDLFKVNIGTDHGCSLNASHGALSIYVKQGQNKAVTSLNANEVKALITWLKKHF